MPGAIDRLYITQSTTPGTTRIAVYYIENEYHIVDSKGVVTETVPASVATYYLTLTWTNAGWSVVNMNEAV